MPGDARGLRRSGAQLADKNLPILIVDDYKTMLRIIRNLLRQLDFDNIDEATDGGMALAMLRQKRYGLVISDWNMQPVTGLELLRQVRAGRASSGRRRSS